MVLVLIATFNGEKYLAEQLDSILRQSYQDFQIYIGDDGSSDGTCDIINKYVWENPGKVFNCKFISDAHGAWQNFMRMMVMYKSDYIMLCDQDDVWFPDKIEITLKEMKMLEERYGQAAPILVHTDLIVTDNLLKIRSNSFLKSMNSDCTRSVLNEFLVQNVITGCTAMYNRALADIFKEIPEFMVMHDWWAGIAASAFGHIGYVNNATGFYRQHESNHIGAREVKTISYKLTRLKDSAHIKKTIGDTYLQAQCFLDMYSARLNEEQIRILELYCRIPNMNKFQKWKTIVKNRFLKNGFTRRIAQFVFI